MREGAPIGKKALRLYAENRLYRRNPEREGEARLQRADFSALWVSSSVTEVIKVCYLNRLQKFSILTDSSFALGSKEPEAGWHSFPDSYF